VHDLAVPARYRVRIEKEGFFTWSREVDMIDEIRVDVLATLVALDVPGTLRLTLPDRVEAWFDGERIGAGPGEVVADGSEGEHQLRLRRDGVLVRDVVINLTAGRTTELDARAWTLGTNLAP